MEQLEVQIVAHNPGSIDINFEESKAYLAAVLEEYKTAVFTDDSIKLAKKYVADFRKQQKAIKDRVTEVKKAYMAPFDEFKEKADELVRLYDEPINFINGQVQNFEERRKEEKLERIKAIYEETFQNLEGIIKFEKVMNERWLNSTYKESDIKQDLDDLAHKYAADINAIRAFNSKYCEEAESLYLNTFDLAAAIKLIHDKEEFERAVIERQKAEEQQRQIEEIRRQEREKLLQEQKAEEEKQKAVEQAKAEAIDAYIPDQTDEDPVAYLYSINLTIAEKQALEMYMDSVGIEYTEV